MELQDTQQYPEFNVKVIKDEDTTLSQQNRYRPEDICIVPTRHDSTFNGFYETHFKQVSLAVAAAMTCHKVQGLTMPQIYFCLHKIFGFGIPYTAFTRTPFKANIAIVGVPPRDIFEAIFFKDETGSSMLTRKQREIEKIIRNLESHIDKDIAAGNVDLKQVEKELHQKMTYEEREDHRQTTKQSQ